MLSIIFLQPFHGVMAHKSLDKATPHWQNHKTNGDSDASKWAAKEKQSLSTTLCFDNGDISDLSIKQDHLLPTAHCFGGGNTSKWAAKGFKNMRPKQSIDDDENTTMWNYSIVNKNTTTTKHFGIAVFFFFDVFFFILFLLLFLGSANVLILNGLIC